MLSFFANLFGYVLNWIYMLIQNYGIAIIIFSILIKIIMLPLSINQQKSLKKNEKIQKEMKIIQVKHNGNQEKINQEMMELYKREKINPFSGCFSIIIQLILLLAMFSLVRMPLTYMKKIDNQVIEDKIVEIKENYGEDKISSVYPQISIIKFLQQEDKENEMFINMDFLGLDLSNIPQENYKDVKVYIIPVLYVISSIISIRISTRAINKKKEEKIEKVDEENSTELVKKDETNQEELMGQMNKNMSLMMPILSVSVSLVAPLGLALYWLVNNIIMIIERLVLNKIFSKEEKENA